MLWKRLRLRGDAGIGLAELVVTVAIGSIVLGAVGTLFAGMLKSSTVSRDRTSATADARLAVDTMARRLRVAVIPNGQSSAFTVATPTQVSFFASLRRTGTDDPVATAVTYRYDTTRRCLTETKTPGTLPANSAIPTFTGASTTTCLTLGDVNTAGTVRLFQYYADGTTTTPTPANATTGAVTTLTSIRSVEVLAQVTARGSSAKPTVVTTRVTQPNLTGTSS